MYKLLIFDKATDELIITQPVVAPSYQMVIKLGEEILLGLCFDHGIMARYEIKEV